MITLTNLGVVSSSIFKLCRGLCGGRMGIRERGYV